MSEQTVMTLPDPSLVMRVACFLRPMLEGGMGSGDCEWIAHCFNVRIDRVREAMSDMEARGLVERWHDGRYRLTDTGRLFSREVA